MSKTEEIIPKDTKNPINKKKFRIIIAIICAAIVLIGSLIAIIVLTFKKDVIYSDFSISYNNFQKLTQVEPGSDYDISTQQGYYSNGTVIIQNNTNALFGIYSYFDNKMILDAKYQKDRIEAIEIVDLDGNSTNENIFKVQTTRLENDNEILFYNDRGEDLKITKFNEESGKLYSTIKQKYLRLSEKRKGIDVNTEKMLENIEIEVSNIEFLNAYIFEDTHYEFWSIEDNKNIIYTNIYKVSNKNRILVSTISNEIGTEIGATSTKTIQSLIVLKDGGINFQNLQVVYENSTEAQISLTYYDSNYNKLNTAYINLNDNLTTKGLRVGDYAYFQYKIPCSENKYDFAEIENDVVKYYKLETYKLNLKNGDYDKINFNYLITNYQNNNTQFPIPTLQIQVKEINNKLLQNTQNVVITEGLKVKEINYEINTITKITSDRYLVENDNTKLLIDNKYNLICNLGNYSSYFTTKESIILKDSLSGYSYVCDLNGIVVKKYLNDDIINIYDNTYYMIKTTTEKDGKTYNEKYLERLGVRQDTPLYSVEQGQSSYIYNDESYSFYSDSIVSNGIGLITRVKQENNKYTYDFYNSKNELIFTLKNADYSTIQPFLKHKEDGKAIISIAVKGLIEYTFVVS